MNPVSLSWRSVLALACFCLWVPSSPAESNDLFMPGTAVLVNFGALNSKNVLVRKDRFPSTVRDRLYGDKQTLDGTQILERLEKLFSEEAFTTNQIQQIGDVIDEINEGIQSALNRQEASSTLNATSQNASQPDSSSSESLQASDSNFPSSHHRESPRTENPSQSRQDLDTAGLSPFAKEIQRLVGDRLSFPAIEELARQLQSKKPSDRWKAVHTFLDAIKPEEYSNQPVTQLSNRYPRLKAAIESHWIQDPETLHRRATATGVPPIDQSAAKLEIKKRSQRGDAREVGRVFGYRPDSAVKHAARVKRDSGSFAGREMAWMMAFISTDPKRLQNHFRNRSLAGFSDDLAKKIRCALSSSETPACRGLRAFKDAYDNYTRKAVELKDKFNWHLQQARNPQITPSEREHSRLWNRMNYSARGAANLIAKNIPSNLARAAEIALGFAFEDSKGRLVLKLHGTDLDLEGKGRFQDIYLARIDDPDLLQTAAKQLLAFNDWDDRTSTTQADKPSRIDRFDISYNVEAHNKKKPALNYVVQQGHELKRISDPLYTFPNPTQPLAKITVQPLARRVAQNPLVSPPSTPSSTHPRSPNARTQTDVVAIGPPTPNVRAQLSDSTSRKRTVPTRPNQFVQVHADLILNTSCKKCHDLADLKASPKEVIRRVSAKSMDLIMPPSGSLSGGEIKVLKQWAAQARPTL